MERLSHVRVTPRLYRRFVFVIIVLSALIIVTGGAVRLTNSGLGCTNAWVTCDTAGHVVKMDAGSKATIESLNRGFTGVIAVVSVLLAVGGSLLRRPYRKRLTWISLGFVAAIFAQSVLGALAVAFKLAPQIVMAHFILSMVILWNALYLYFQARRLDVPGASVPPPPPPDSVRRLARALFVVAGAVVFLGTVVTAGGPHAGDAGVRDRLHPLPYVDVVRIHSVSALALTAGSLVLLWLVFRRPVATSTRRSTVALVAVIACQVAIGYTQYFLGLPALVVGFHLAGAAAMWIAVVTLNLTIPTRKHVVGAAEVLPGQPATVPSRVAATTS